MWQTNRQTDKQDETKVMFRHVYKPGVTVTLFGDVSKRNDVWKSSGADHGRNETNAHHRGKGTNRLVFWFEVDADEMASDGIKLEITPSKINDFIALLLSPLEERDQCSSSWEGQAKNFSSF